MKANVLITIVMVLLGLTGYSQDTTLKPVKTTGVASFYASKFNGRKTCSGQKFSNDSLTAAHKSLKLGTYVQVRNLKNDSMVVVRINDRLPRSSKRSIDLTQRAAKQLNFMRAGLTKVEITVLDSADREVVNKDTAKK
jgi:rare lipoprotein A